MIASKSTDVITLDQPNHVQPSSVQTVTYLPLISNSDYKMQPFIEHRNWSNGLCDCFSELSFCCCTFWCPFQPIALLYERVVSRGSYWTTFYSLGFCYIIYYLIEIIGTTIFLAYPSLSDSDNGFLLNIALIINDPLSWIGFTLAFFMTCIVRKEIRSMYEIPEQTCIGSEDCCCAFWCTGCTICQIWKHVTGGAKNGAKGCNCTKDPEQGCC